MREKIAKFVERGIEQYKISNRQISPILIGRVVADQILSLPVEGCDCTLGELPDKAPTLIKIAQWTSIDLPSKPTPLKVKIKTEDTKLCVEIISWPVEKRGNLYFKSKSGFVITSINSPELTAYELCLPGEDFTRDKEISTRAFPNFQEMTTYIENLTEAIKEFNTQEESCEKK